jgi:hypothetical protein
VAPFAAQRTAFQENRGADSRPVVDSETFDIENNSLHQEKEIKGNK